MRDIPYFETEFGNAGLVLNQIPYTNRAYIHLHDYKDLENLVRECVQFCIACGAEQVYISGSEDYFADKPYVSLIEMVQLRKNIRETDAYLCSVTDETLNKWLSLYHDRMTAVDHAAHISELEGKRMIEESGGYFIHRNGKLLGIGRAKEDTIACVAAIERGAGRDVVLALCHALTGEYVRLEVASTNLRAIHLYENLGFYKKREVCRWYRIL